MNRDHNALLSAANAAIRRIERLEHGLLVCVSTSDTKCKNGAKCGDRRWDNPECDCAAAARQFLPVGER